MGDTVEPQLKLIL